MRPVTGLASRPTRISVKVKLTASTPTPSNRVFTTLTRPILTWWLLQLLKVLRSSAWPCPSTWPPALWHTKMLTTQRSKTMIPAKPTSFKLVSLTLPLFVPLTTSLTWRMFNSLSVELGTMTLVRLWARLEWLNFKQIHSTTSLTPSVSATLWCWWTTRLTSSTNALAPLMKDRCPTILETAQVISLQHHNGDSLWWQWILHILIPSTSQYLN